MQKVGIDFGGSHIAVGLVENGKVIERKVFLYKNKENDESLMQEIRRIEKYINEIKSKTNVESIGISLPGNCKDGVLLDAKNIKNFNIVGTNVEKYVSKKLEMPVFIENDALCALIGERKYGALQNYPHSLMLTFGTGIGYGLCFEENGEEYYLDNDGRDYIDEYGASFSKSLTTLHTLKKVYSNEIENDNISRRTIFEDIKKDNSRASKLLKRYIENNCNGILKMHELTKIDTFCSGGGLSEYGELFIDNMREKLPDLRILIAQNMNDAGLIGATELQGIKKKNIKFEIENEVVEK